MDNLWQRIYWCQGIDSFTRPNGSCKDSTAYGCIIVQGHGKLGVYDAETAVMLRYGQMSADEYFVSEQAGEKGTTKLVTFIINLMSIA